MILKTGSKLVSGLSGYRVIGLSGYRVSGLSGYRVSGLDRRTRKPANSQTKGGFTLIEVMVTTAILSLGVVLIYKAFFISLDSFNYCSDYLAAAPLMDEKIWQAQEQLNSQGLSAQPQASGQVRVNNKEFNWYLRCVPLTPAQDLFKIDLVFSWQQGGRNKKLSRAAYAIYTKE